MDQIGLTILVGFVSGILSGMFGVGGGFITTPAIRWVLGAPALVAVGTPLPVILPSALTGAISYRRRGLADLRSGLTLGLAGSPFSVLGATLATKVGGRVVLLVTGLAIVYMAIDMALQVLRPRPGGDSDGKRALRVSGPDKMAPGEMSSSRGASSAARTTLKLHWPVLAMVGALTGLYSGFLGLGGGLILVPLLTRWLRFPIKSAIGTSLIAIAVLAVPGSIAHLLLGNVDARMALFLIAGVVPGALVGARITFGASDRAVRLGFTALLGAVGALLLISESGVLW